MKFSYDSAHVDASFLQACISVFTFHFLELDILGDAFANRLGATYVTGALLMFIVLILIFIALESVFLWLSRRGEQA